MVLCAESNCFVPFAQSKQCYTGVICSAESYEGSTGKEQSAMNKNWIKVAVKGKPNG
jgi:hypothetical protein